MISPKTLLRIEKRITRTHGADIAHDVIVVMLESQEVIEKPLQFASRTAMVFKRKSMQRGASVWREVSISSLSPVAQNLLK